MQKNDYSQRQGVLTGTDLDRALSMLPANSKTRTAAVNFFLDMYPGTSVRQALRHRRNIRGADKEMSRAFAQYVHASSYHMAQLKYGHRISNAIKRLKKYVRDSAAGLLGRRAPEYTYQMDTIVKELERRENDYQLAEQWSLVRAGRD